LAVISALYKNLGRVRMSRSRSPGTKNDSAAFCSGVVLLGRGPRATFFFGRSPPLVYTRWENQRIVSNIEDLYTSDDVFPCKDVRFHVLGIR